MHKKQLVFSTSKNGKGAIVNKKVTKKSENCDIILCIEDE